TSIGNLSQTTKTAENSPEPTAALPVIKVCSSGRIGSLFLAREARVLAVKRARSSAIDPRDARSSAGQELRAARAARSFPGAGVQCSDRRNGGGKVDRRRRSRAGSGRARGP